MKDRDIMEEKSGRTRSLDTTVRKGSIHDDHDLEYMNYFLSRPMEERFAAVEKLREAMHGEDYATKLRLSRSTIRIQRRSR